MVKLKRILSTALCVAMLFSVALIGPPDSAMSAKAATSAEIQAQLDAAKKESNRLKAEIASLEAANAPHEKQRQAIRRQIEATVKEITLFEEQIALCEKDIKNLNKDIATLDDKCQAQADEFKKRLVAIYTGKNSFLSDLSFLMSSSNMADYLAKVELLETMSRRDNMIIEQLKKDIEAVEKKKAAIDAKKAELDKAKKDIDAKKLILNEQYKKVNSIVMSNEEAIRQAEKQAAEQKQREKDLQKALEDAKIFENGAVGTGKMAWPVIGFQKITSPFGYRIHPLTGKWKLHTGTDIAGAGCYGARIVAADSGVVILSKYYGGYGNCVMIDHGNGLVTLYAHMSKPSTLKVGQSVYKGKTTVGYVGESGNVDGPHLHFECIKNGEYINPMQFY